MTTPMEFDLSSALAGPLFHDEIKSFFESEGCTNMALFTEWVNEGKEWDEILQGDQFACVERKHVAFIKSEWAKARRQLGAKGSNDGETIAAHTQQQKLPLDIKDIDPAFDFKLAFSSQGVRERIKNSIGGRADARLRGKCSKPKLNPSDKGANEPLHMLVTAVDASALEEAVEIATNAVEALVRQYNDWHSVHLKSQGRGRGRGRGRGNSNDGEAEGSKAEAKFWGKSSGKGKGRRKEESEEAALPPGFSREDMLAKKESEAPAGTGKGKGRRRQVEDEPTSSPAVGKGKKKKVAEDFTGTFNDGAPKSGGGGGGGGKGKRRKIEEGGGDGVGGGKMPPIGEGQPQEKAATTAQS